MAQRVSIEAFEGVHVVFLFTLRVCQVGERLGAQVEGEEVADRAFRAVDRGGVNGRPVSVAVGGVEIKIPQAVQVGEGIISEQRGDARTRLLAKLQPAGAIERREKMSDRGTIRQQRADVLEEAAAAAVIVERAGRPKSQPRVIGYFGTVPEVGTAFGQTVEWSQERRLQRERSRCHNGAKKISHRQCKD